MTKQLPRSWDDMRRDWTLLTAYQRFETLIAWVLTVVIAAVILVAVYRLRREMGIIQARIVILIALLALARKVIIIDLFATAPATVAALGLLALCLEVTYWLIRDRNDDPFAQSETS